LDKNRAIIGYLTYFDKVSLLYSMEICSKPEGSLKTKGVMPTTMEIGNEPEGSLKTKGVMPQTMEIGNKPEGSLKTKGVMPKTLLVHK
jgi:hypothetical protein